LGTGSAIERARGDCEFLLRVHLGNYALWLAGVRRAAMIRPPADHQVRPVWGPIHFSAPIVSSAYA